MESNPSAAAGDDGGAGEILAMGFIRIKNLFIFISIIGILNGCQDYQIDRCIKSLGSPPNEELHKWAYNKLREIGKPATEKLIQALEDKNPQTRENAASLLGEIKDERAIAPLIEKLKNEENRMAGIAAARAVAKMGEIGITSLLETYHETKNFLAAEFILNGLEIHIKDDRVFNVFLDALNGYKGREVKNCALYELGKNKEVRALGRIIETFDFAYLPGYPFGNDSAIEALVEIGKPSVYPLIDILKENKIPMRNSLWRKNYTKLNVAFILKQIKDERSENYLMDALKSEDLELVAGAYDYYIRKGVEASVPVLIKALTNAENPGVWSERMANTYRNCGNSRLSTAALEYARRLNLRWETAPSNVKGLTWGVK